MRARTRVAILAPIVALAVAVVPTVASASTVTGTAPNVLYTAAAGEINNVTLSRDGSVLRIKDTGVAAITPTAPCLAVTANEVTCPVAGISTVDLSLNDMNDIATVADSVVAPLNVGLRGQAGSDTLTGGANVSNFLIGDDSSVGAGNDILTGGGLGDSIFGLDGNDVIDGGGGADSIRPGLGADTVNAGPGSDRFLAEDSPDGPDTYSGGSGSDTAEYNQRSGGVVITEDGVADDGAPGEGDNIMPDVEQIFTGSGDDTVVGGPGPNAIITFDGNDTIDGGDGIDIVNGAQGDDTVTGGAGNDSVFGSLGQDTVDGGPGDDTLGAGDGDGTPDVYTGGPGTDLIDYSGDQEAVNISLDGVADDGLAGEGDNAMPDIEDATGTAAGDTLSGNASPNELSGGDGSDSISGLDGPDALLGGRGDDSLDGGEATDLLAGGDGADRLRSRDSGPDELSCGGGVDTALVDAFDSPRADCDEQSTGVVIGTRSAKLSNAGSTTVPLSCPTAEAVTCEGALTLQVGAKRNSRRGAARKTIAKAKYSIPSGATEKVKLRLVNGAGLGRRAVATATASMTDVAGAVVDSRRRIVLSRGGSK